LASAFALAAEYLSSPGTYIFLVGEAFAFGGLRWASRQNRRLLHEMYEVFDPADEEQRGRLILEKRVRRVVRRASLVAALVVGLFYAAAALYVAAVVSHAIDERYLHTLPLLGFSQSSTLLPHDVFDPVLTARGHATGQWVVLDYLALVICVSLWTG